MLRAFTTRYLSFVAFCWCLAILAAITTDVFSQVRAPTFYAPRLVAQVDPSSPEATGIVSKIVSDLPAIAAFIVVVWLFLKRQKEDGERLSAEAAHDRRSREHIAKSAFDSIDMLVKTGREFHERLHKDAQAGLLEAKRAAECTAEKLEENTMALTRVEARVVANQPTWREDRER